MRIELVGGAAVLFALASFAACGSSSESAPSADGDAGVGRDASAMDTSAQQPFDAAFQDTGTPDGASDPCSELIDFETVPGAAPAPADGLAIDMQYRALHHVSFGLEAGPAPILAKVGNPATAFNNDEPGVGDTPAPGQKNGMFFLTDDGVVGDPPSPLVITYEQAVSGAYGEILDIDGAEEWTIDARDAKDVILESVVLTAGKPGTGDAIATPVSFKRNAADIRSLRIRYTGASGAVGLAFDNFSPACSAPVVK